MRGYIRQENGEREQNQETDTQSAGAKRDSLTQTSDNMRRRPKSSVSNAPSAPDGGLRRKGRLMVNKSWQTMSLRREAWSPFLKCLLYLDNWLTWSRTGQGEERA